MSKNVIGSKPDEDKKHADFDYYDERIEIRRFLDTNYQDDRDQYDSQKTKQVEHGVCRGKSRWIDALYCQLPGYSTQLLPVPLVEHEGSSRRSRKLWAHSDSEITQ